MELARDTRRGRRCRLRTSAASLTGWIHTAPATAATSQRDQPSGDRDRVASFMRGTDPLQENEHVSGKRSSDALV
jgi:hypothetical protein